MAEAVVQLKLKPRQFDLVVMAVRDYWETQNDFLNDPVVKQEDKEPAAQEAFEAANILRELGYQIERK